jgi:hypothetical protein
MIQWDHCAGFFISAQKADSICLSVSGSGRGIRLPFDNLILGDATTYTNQIWFEKEHHA